MPTIPAAALITICLASCAAVAADAPAKRPNVVFILADDLGYECLSCNGSTSYQTPNVDALAAAGVRFTHATCTPLCSPSRVQVMTGRYGFRTGWTRLISGPKEFLDWKKERTFAHILKDAGYATAVAGKWQLAGFEHHPDHAKLCGFDEYCLWAWVYKGPRTARYWDPAIWQDGKLREDTKGKYGEDVFADFLIDFIGRNKDKPFFAYYPMVLTHDPFEPTPDSRGAAGAEKADKAEKKKKKAEGGAGASPANFPHMVRYMDKTVGRVVAALDKHGLRENTLIIFSGDNGTPKGIRSNVGDVVIPGGKGTVTEIGTHVPLIASWKGVSAVGKVCDDLIDFTDVLPTICEATGAAVPKDRTIDGRSFLAQIKGQAGNPREWVFSRLGNASFVRDRRWLLHDDGRLFEIGKDPFEKTDRAKDTDPDVVAARQRLAAVLEKMK